MIGGRRFGELASRQHGCVVLSCPTPRCSLTTWPSPVSVVSTSPGLPRGAQPVSPAIVGSRVLHEAQPR